MYCIQVDVVFATRRTTSLCAVPCCSYFLSLALTPSAMIGLDANLRAPKVELLCNCKPSLYAYPPPVTTGEHGSLEPAGWGRPPLLLMHLNLPSTRSQLHRVTSHYTLCISRPQSWLACWLRSFDFH